MDHQSINEESFRCEEGVREKKIRATPQKDDGHSTQCSRDVQDNDQAN